jgi:hypothetical protein
MTVLGASYQPPEAARATRARAFETAHALAAAVPVVRLDLPRELPPPETLGGVVAARLDALGLP